MAAQKLEKALYGPSLVEVILGVILGLLAGVVAACLFLVFKPVKSVQVEPAKEAIRGMVYYLPGATSNAKSHDWLAKQKQFLAGTSVEVVEDELNAWSAALPQSVVSSSPAKPAKTPAKPGVPPAKPVPDDYLITTAPNFRITAGRLQVGVKCTLNWYGLMQDVMAQATGSFRKDGDAFVFVPETVYLGSCPLHLLPVAPGLLISAIASKQKIPDEIRAAWAKLNNVTLEGKTLKLAAQ